MMALARIRRFVVHMKATQIVDLISCGTEEAEGHAPAPDTTSEKIVFFNRLDLHHKSPDSSGSSANQGLEYST